MVTFRILVLIWLLQNRLAFLFMNLVVHLLQGKVREVLTRSTCSAQLSVKRLKVQAKLKTAQLEAIQQKERAIEKNAKLI